MVIDLNPVLLQLGPYGVRWFGVLSLLGLALGTWLSVRADPRAAHAAVWAIPIGVLAARLAHALGWWDFSPSLWPGDLALWGGLVGGAVAAAVALGADRRPVLDTAAAPVALGLAIGQLGAFLDGSGQGVPASLPWATQYAHPLAATPDFGVPRHPVQLYDALVLGALALILTRLPLSSRAAVFVVCFGVARLALSGVRTDPAFVFGWQLEQVLAAGAIVVGVVYGLRAVRALGAPAIRQAHRRGSAAA